jgi:hypothetical protein
MQKVVVSHSGALRSKYSNRHPEVVAAVEQLARVDAARGLQTRFICIDQDIMRDLGGSPSSRVGLCDIRDFAAQREAKEAVDLIVTSLSPDYIAILDGPDVIPHVRLDNPAREVREKFVDSDLPYASDADYSRNVLDYLSVTRAVARIPNAPGAANPDPVIRCLNTAAKFKSRPSADYCRYFALSAPEFALSAKKSLRAIFNGDKDLDVVPPADSSNIGARFSRLGHFINCHGLPSTSKFYGGPAPGGEATVAMTSEQVAAQATEEVLVVSECCFGAHLYDPKEAEGIGPICLSYFVRGALGYLGSTNTVFGGFSEDTYGKGDFLARFFFDKVLAGARLGEALAEARQQFIKTQSMCDPGNLKTLAQFVLFGDPSAVPCQALRTEMRYVTRKSLAKDGHAIAQAAIVPSGPGSIPEALKAEVRATAIDKGYQIVGEDISKCKGWAGAQSGATDTPEFVMTVSAEAEPIVNAEGKTGNRSRYIIAYIANDKIIRLEEAASH